MVLASGRRYYTRERIPEIEFSMGKILQIIVPVLVKEIKPQAIILHGSFSRGEGTILLSNNQPFFISDIEIGCITQKWWKRLVLFKINKKLEKDLGIELTLSFFSPSRFYSGRPSNWMFLKNPITLEQYELISSSYLLWGMDPFNCSIKPNTREIPKWDAIRLVFNRVAELVNALIATPNDTLNIKKNTIKLLIACGDSILLLNQRYHYSYFARKKQLTKLIHNKSFYPKEVEWETILAAYKWKLFPNENKSLEITLDKTIDCLLKVLNWALRDTRLNKFVNSETDISNIYLDNFQLNKFCRFFPGKPFLQSTMIIFKQLVRGYPPTLSLSIWREVHITYVKLLNFLIKIVRKTDNNVSRKNQISSKDFLTGLNLIRKWKLICCMV